MLRKIILLLLVAIMIWLAYPFVGQLIDMRGESGEGMLPGRLELPPVDTAVDSVTITETDQGTAGSIPE